MNHRKHMIPCLIALVAAMTFFAMAGSNPLAAGLGLAFLLCPIVMGTVVWLLMRQPTRPLRADSRPAQEAVAADAVDSKRVSGSPL